MEILVTGGAGFIGSNLVRRLLSSGHSVRILDDLSTGLLTNLDGLDVDFRLGSITDLDTVQASADGVDSVVHLAARGSVARSIAEPQETHAVNATGTLNVLEAARVHSAHIVVASSSSVYGSNEKLPKDEQDWTQPLSPYGASKLAAESYALSYQEVFGVKTLVLRFFNVYGPFQRPDHDYAAVIPKFAWSALTGRALEIHGDGEQSRDFTHVDVVVDVIYDALVNTRFSSRPINLALGDSTTVNEVADELERSLGIPLSRNYGPPRSGDIRASMNNPARLKEFFPTIQNICFRDGLQSVVQWLETIYPRQDPNR